MNGRGKVLVFGDDTRSFLATVRSLARAGLDVHVAPFNFLSPALKSRYIAQIVYLPYYIEDGRDWLAAARKLLRAENYELLIPCDERTIFILQHHREELSRWTRLAIPDDHSIDILFDKIKTRNLAQSLGIPVTVGRAIAPGDTAEPLIAEVGLPLAVKPSQSYTVSQLYSRNRVEIVATGKALDAVLSDLREGRHLVEAFFEGRGVGVSVLSSKGKILQAFEHWRVHELHGSAYYRVSAALSPALLDAAEKMVVALAYTGLAMFEFRLNEENGEWVLLEVNARPWGSLPLPVALGVDFPFRWYQLLVKGVETPSHEYRIGIYGRNFVPDLLQLPYRLRLLRRNPLRMMTFLIRNILEYYRLVIGREYSDVFTFDDPKPGLTELWRLFIQGGQQAKPSLPGARSSWKIFDRRRLHRRISRRTRGGVTIIFVCQGNICRSPLAEALLGRYLEPVSNTVRIGSAGMLPRMGVRSPSNAITAASGMELDLGHHRSQHLSRDMVSESTVIVAFDDINLSRIRDRYEFLKPKIVMLGSFVQGNNFPLWIADPDGGDLTAFQLCYAHIDAAVRGLAVAVRKALDAW